MLKADWAAPTDQPNPRRTLATYRTPSTQEALLLADKHFRISVCLTARQCMAAIDESPAADKR